MTWSNALVACQEIGANLVSINSAGEDEFVSNICGQTNCWIGLNDAVEEGNYKWSDGSPFDYSNWDSDQPNPDGSEDYILIRNNFVVEGKWHDFPASSTWIGICEITKPTAMPTRAPTYDGDLLNDFDLIDKDEDGFLNYDEMAFDIADVDKDGILSLEEYESACADSIFAETVHDSDMAIDFDRIDRNDDGFLSYDEVAFDIADIFKDGLLSLGEYASARADGLFADTVH